MAEPGPADTRPTPDTSPPPDPRPRPRYGEYADPAPVADPVLPSPVTVATPEPAPPRRRRTWDVVLTTALLALAVYDVIGGYSTFADLSPAIQIMFDQTGVGQFTATAVALQWGFIANVARIAILVVVILVSLLLVARRRLAFWVPLTGGAVAGLVVLVAVTAIIVNDPAYIAYLTSMQP